MSDEILALLDKPHLMIAVLFVGGLIGGAVEQIASRVRRRAWRKRNGWPAYSNRAAAPLYALPSALSRLKAQGKDAADQLRIVMGAEFAAQPLLNKGEARLFRELDAMVLGYNPGWQVMAQVSLGEILRSRDSAAYGCINSKRVDLLLVDAECRPRLAVEYQGGGHYQGTAAARDAVKREALRKAGIAYHEVVAGQTTPSELRRLIERHVERPPSTGAIPGGQTASAGY